MKAIAGGFLLLLLPLARDAMAAEPGSIHDVGRWKASANRGRLHIGWETLRRPIARVPSLPALVFVAREQTPDRARIERDILADVRTILALRGFTAVRVAPNDALDLPWFRSVVVRDPMIVVVGGNSEVVGTLAKSREFKVTRCLDLLARAAGGGGHLSRYLRASIEILRKTERAWKKGESAPGLVEEEERLLDDWVGRLGGGSAAYRGTSAEAREAVRFFRQSERAESPRRRAAAVESLGLIDSGPGAREILAASRDESLWVRLAAGRALGRMKSYAARQETLAALRGEEEQPLVSALLAFEKIQAPDLAPRFVRLLESGSEEVRYAALRALVPQRSAAAAPALVGVLQADAPALRVLAARALAGISDPRTVPALAAQLDAEDWSVRKAAIEALGRVRRKPCIAPLVERMDREDGHVRSVARTALIGLTAIDWGVRPGKWKAWWRDAEASFQVPNLDDAADALSFCHLLKREPNERVCATVRTHSRRLAFVIDLTTGMNERARLPAHVPADMRRKHAGVTRFEAVR
ncbi:MAG: HEAT repeat domain-containing protein, partial [Planctomycetota bacterium]